MTYLVIAKDGTDPDAPTRRQEVREEHLERVQPAVGSGFVRLGGALLNNDGTMIGSAMLLEADSEEEVRAFINQDVYTTGGVWQSYEVYPFKRAVGVSLG